MALFVVGTRRAWADWIDCSVLFSEIQNSLGQDSCRVSIGFLEYDFDAIGSFGERSEKAFWDLFRDLKTLLSGEALALGERLMCVEGNPQQLLAPSEHVILDITHGFRAGPFLSGAVLQFVASEQRRTEAPRAINHHILYAAADVVKQMASQPAFVPVWDLTRFMAVARWNAAIDALMRYGRADDLEALGQEDSGARKRVSLTKGASRDELALDGISVRFGKGARALADDLALNRWKFLFQDSAPSMRDFLKGSDAAELGRRLPLLDGAMRELLRWVEPLCAPNVLGVEGLRATAMLAERYGQLQRFAEQAAAVREGLVTQFALLKGGFTIIEPKQSGCKDARHSVEDAWNQAVFHPPYDDARRANLECSRATQEPRNDIEHGGINNQPKSAQKLRDQLKALTRRFCELALADDVQPPARSTLPPLAACFLNLSNHPIAVWPIAQIDAARALDLGEPVEAAAPPPAISPDIDESAVADLADIAADAAVAQGARGAFVASDFTFTFALVCALQARGVRCFAATSARETTERPDSSGASVKAATFRFVRWREYGAV